MGERERDLDEPDADDFDDDDDDDRLIDALLLRCLGEEDGLTSAFARSGRGGGSNDATDNVLAVFNELSKQNSSITNLSPSILRNKPEKEKQLSNR